MRVPLTAVPAAALAALIVTGCGSSAPAGARTSADPLQGITGQRAVTEAVAGTDAAPGVRFSGTLSDSGQKMSVSMALAAGKGCAGTISVANEGSVKIIYDGTTAWMLPDQKFLQAEAGSDASALESALAGRYIKLAPGNSALAGLTRICTVKTLLSISAASKFGTPVRTPFAGQPALKVPDATEGSFAYVSDTSAPRLLGITKPGSGGGSITFTYPAAPPVITVPPAADSVDGSTLGM